MSPAQKIGRLFLIYLLTVPVLILYSGFSDDEIIAESVLLSRVPKTIGLWQGEDLDDNRAKDTFLLKDTRNFYPLVRTYQKSGAGLNIVMIALEDLKGFQRDIHDPRICYESQGWTVLKYQDIHMLSEKRPLGIMKLLTYTNSTNTVRRMEIYGYLAEGEVFTSDITLRLTHIKNRLMRMFIKSSGHVIYLSLSADLKKHSEEVSLNNLKFLMGEVLGTLVL